MKIRVSFLIIILVLASSTQAFDGKRKGFVLGGGIGFSPITYFHTEDDDIENSTESISFGLSVGYGISRTDMLVIDVNVVPHGLSDIPGVTISQNFIGLCWYHYLSSSVHSPLVIVGAGSVELATLNIRFRKASDPPSQTHTLFGGSGMGAKLGVGLQFSRNLQVATEYWLGSYEGRDSKRVSQYVINCRASFLVF